MKKVIWFVLVFFLVSGFSFVFAEEEGKAVLSTKELYSLANRKSYRLGLRGAIIGYGPSFWNSF